MCFESDVSLLCHTAIFFLPRYMEDNNCHKKTDLNKFLSLNLHCIIKVKRDRVGQVTNPYPVNFYVPMYKLL